MAEWQVDTGFRSQATRDGWVRTETVTLRFGDEMTEHLTPQEARELAGQLMTVADDVEAGAVTP